MEKLIALGIVLFGFIFPLIHVALTIKPVNQPDTSKCPFSPRTGWFIIILILGPLGWLMFLYTLSQDRKNRSLEPTD